MVSRRALLGLGIAAGGIAAAGTGTAWAFSSAMQTARKTSAPELSTVIPTRHGDLEYADRGTGTPVMMVHGTGGGFDQGLLFARPLLDKGYRLISPSRFGYLRSDFPDDASSEAQADALVELLDHLEIDRITIAGGSAGALPAMAFAIRHPDRTAALLPIVPAAYAPNRPPVRPFSPMQQAVTEAMLNSDFLFWAAAAALPDMMIGSVLATDPALVKTATPADRQRVNDILYGILPVSERTRGLINDGRLAGNPTPMALDTISAPTLTISCEDDHYLTADAARHIAATVPGAKAIIYPTGGHLWVGHDADLFDAIDAFLKEIGYA